MLDGLHREMRCWPVNHCHSATVSAWRICSDNTVPSRPAGVDSVSDLGILKDTQVHVGLGHPPKRRLQSPVLSVPNFIGAEPNRHPPTSSTTTHPPPTDAFSSSDPVALPARSGLPFLPFLVPFHPHIPPLSVPVSVPVSFLPPSYSVPFTSAWGTP